MKKARHIEFLILGAGPTGLGAAYRLKELGKTNFLVLEADNAVGGLARSFTDPQGFTWDIGGHVQFSHYPYFDELMLKAIPQEGWLHHERESWVWMCDRFIPYPLQNNIHRLPPQELWKCLEGLLRRTTKSSHLELQPSNFREWAVQKFGEELTALFFHPYNFKVWATDPKEMSFQWVGERVSIIDVKRILQNLVFNRDDVSWGPNNRFAFPKKGGTGAIWEAVADLVGRKYIELKQRVTGLDTEKKEVSLVTGEKITYGALLSTMPLRTLVELTHKVPAPITREAKNLRFSTTHIVGLGLEGKLPSELTKKCWMYFPEDNCPFYRVTVFSHYSPENVPNPKRQYSLMLEVSESDQKAVVEKELLGDVIQGASNTGLIKDGTQIISRWQMKVPFGYPVPTQQRDAALAKIMPFFEKNNVFSRGRFGGWKYEVANQDHSAMQGVEWVDRLVQGKPERTYSVADGTSDPNLTLRKKAS